MKTVPLEYVEEVTGTSTNNCEQQAEKVENTTFEYVNLPSDFKHICIVCHDPLIDPVISMGVCWHKSCRICGETWAKQNNTCPICRKEGFGANFINYDDFDVKYELDNLDVKCPHCMLTVKRGNLQDHLHKTCPLLEGYKKLNEKEVILEKDYLDKEDNLKKSYNKMNEALHEDIEKLKTKLLEEINQQKQEIQQREIKFKNQVLSRQKYENREKPIQFRLIDMNVFASIDSFVNNERDPSNSIGAMLSGEYPSFCIPSNTMENPIFIDVNYQNFNHTLNWLKHGIVPQLSDYRELIGICNRYQLHNLLLKIEEYKQYHPISQYEFINFLHWNTSKQPLNGFKLEGLNMKDINLSDFEIRNSLIIDVDFTLSKMSNMRFINCKFINVGFSVDKFANVTFNNCSFPKMKCIIEKNMIKFESLDGKMSWTVTEFNVDNDSIVDYVTNLKFVAKFDKILLKKFHNLTELDISGSKIGVEGVKEIGKLINLTKLNINFNNIDVEGVKEIGKLINLTELDINLNNIGVEGAKEIGKLINLTKLNISYNNIGYEGAKEIGKLINLTELNIHNNNIGDEGVKEIVKLINLTQLNIFGNKIGDEGAKEIVKLINLTELSIGNNNIGDEGAKEIVKLINLTQLDISHNNISDEGVKEIVKLINLTKLDIDDNNISDEGAKEIGKLINLTELNIYNNNISDKGAKEMCERLQNTKIY